MSRALPAPEGGILLQGQAGTLTRIALADFMLAATPGALAIAGARVTLRGPVWTPAPSVTAPWTPVALNPGAWALVDNNPQTRMGP
jgi:hypothetical protein